MGARTNSEQTTTDHRHSRGSIVFVCVSVFQIFFHFKRTYVCSDRHVRTHSALNQTMIATLSLNSEDLGYAFTRKYIIWPLCQGHTKKHSTLIM